MTDKVYYVNIRVYLKELLSYYKDNPDYGAPDKPYPADFFSEIIAPSSVFYGPLRNIMVLKDDAVYRWTIDSADGTPILFNNSKDSEMVMEMITNQPSKEKWQKIFVNPPDPDDKGRLKIKSKKPNESVFEMTTTNNIKGGGKIKYSFLFEFDVNGVPKYGIIDPVVDPTDPPPDEP